MVTSQRRFGFLAAFGLFLGGALLDRAEAQTPSFNPQAWAGATRVNPNPLIAPGMTLNQAAYNTSVLGRAASNIPPYALGYDPYAYRAGSGYRGPVINPTFVPPDAAAPPVGGVAPYGYSWPGWGYGPGLGSTLAGNAAVISSQGDYLQATQSARLMREQARQEAVKTRKMQLQEQLEYEAMQPKAIDVIQRTRATDLQWARSGPPDNEIWSGRMLNVLLQSAMLNPSVSSGPNVPLDEDVLRRINIKDKSQRGNIGLLAEGKLRWPAGLQEAVFDEPRDRVTKNLDIAAKQVQYGDPPDIKTMRALRADHKAMVDTLDSGLEGMSPTDFIRAKAYLGKIRETILALNEPTVKTSIDRSWVKSVRTVGDLVNYMKNKGLEFAGAAAPDSYAAYSSLYYSLRTFEIGLNGGGRALETGKGG
jgi:hypothetical protein